MNTDTKIEPSVITTTNTATSFNVRCKSLELFNTASFIATLLDDNQRIISIQTVNLTNEQYLEWNNNDYYIIEIVANALGVTPILNKQ